MRKLRGRPGGTWELFERFGANRHSGAVDRVTIEPGEPAPDAPVNLMGLLRDIGLRFECDQAPGLGRSAAD
jgi:hypothetical protein